jgi:hypothetical protein
MEAAKYILERIAPSRRGRLVEIEGFPAIEAPADVPAAFLARPSQAPLALARPKVARHSVIGLHQ